MSDENEMSIITSALSGVSVSIKVTYKTTFIDPEAVEVQMREAYDTVMKLVDKQHRLQKCTDGELLSELKRRSSGRTA